MKLRTAIEIDTEQKDKETQQKIERIRAMRPQSPTEDIPDPDSSPPPQKISRKVLETEKSTEMLSFLNSSTLDPSDNEDNDANETSSTLNKHVKHSDLQLYPKSFDPEKVKQLKVPELLDQIAKVQTDSPSADGTTRKRITQVTNIFISILQNFHTI